MAFESPAHKKGFEDMAQHLDRFGNPCNGRQGISPAYPGKWHCLACGSMGPINKDLSAANKPGKPPVEATLEGAFALLARGQAAADALPPEKRLGQMGCGPVVEFEQPTPPAVDKTAAVASPEKIDEMLRARLAEQQTGQAPKPLEINAASECERLMRMPRIVNKDVFIPVPQQPAAAQPAAE